MRKDVKKLLSDMKNRPGVYFGKKSLDRLSTFLSGYICCVSERDGEIGEYLPGFQEFISERYNIRSTHHWSEIIQFYCSTEEEAFDEFYKLLDEFSTDRRCAKCNKYQHVPKVFQPSRHCGHRAAISRLTKRRFLHIIVS